MPKTSELTIFYQGTHFSWQELCQKMPGFSQMSASHGMKSFDCLAIPARKRFLTSLFLLQAFMKRDRDFPSIFPVGPGYPDSEKQHLLAQSNAHWLDESIIANPQQNNKDDCQNFDVSLSHSLNHDIVLAIATSGSQTRARIALISRTNIISHCAAFARIISLDSTSVWLNCMPMEHIAGVMIVYRCWFNNAAMLLQDEFDEKQVWTDLHHYGVTHISLVPRMLFRLLEYSQDAAPPENLNYVIVGGDLLSDALYQRAVSAGWPLYISYGMTEATSTIAIGRTSEQLRLLDGFDAQISSRRILRLKGAMVSPGYAGLKTDRQGEWFETKDVIELEGRNLTVLGRSDHMIICGGRNVAPEYIEALLALAPDIDDVAIGKYRYPEADGERGDTIIALVCGDIQKLKRWISKNIQSCLQPRVFIKVKQIPRNSLGKVDRKKIQLLIT